MNYEEVLTRFSAVKRRGANESLARCPCHDDKEQSLQVNLGNNGRILIKCMAGCDTGAILERIGLKWSDIKGNNDTPTDWKAYLEASLSRNGKKHTVVDRYDYRFIDGRYAFTKVRTDPKSFRYGKIVGDRWQWESIKRKEIQPALYTPSITSLKEAIANGTRIYIVEGEKDVNTLRDRGYIAVTVGGAQDWESRYADIFTGGNVVILGDNDSAGKQFAESVKSDLENVTESVKVVYPSEQEKGDVTDYFNSGASNDDFEAMVNGESVETIDYSKFHNVNKRGVWSVNRNAIAEYIVRTEHIINIGEIPHIYENGVYVPDKHGSRIMTKAKSLMLPDLRDYSHMKAIFSVIDSNSDLLVNPNDINKHPCQWICFENGYYDTINKVMHPHDPKYRTINKIPHKYDPNKVYERNEVDEFLECAIPDEETREMVLQYCGLCLTTDTSHQKMLILDGMGGTGKSTLIGMLMDAVGDENYSTVPLNALSERFASYELYRKLLNSCADIDTSAVTDVSVMKQLTGDDNLRGEAKGKDAFSFKSYAKIMFSVNGLPIIKGERTDGFYRRMLVAKFSVKPVVPNPKLPKILNANIETFIDRIVKALERLNANGRIFESKASKASVQAWRLDGDSVEAWVEERLYKIVGVKTERKALYENYIAYCREYDRTSVGSTTFYAALRNKGFNEAKVHGVRYFRDASLTSLTVVPEPFKTLFSSH